MQDAEELEPISPEKVFGDDIHGHPAGAGAWVAVSVLLFIAGFVLVLIWAGK